MNEATVRAVTVAKNERAVTIGQPTTCSGECCREARLYIRHQPEPVLSVSVSARPILRVEVKYCPFCGGKLT